MDYLDEVSRAPETAPVASTSSLEAVDGGSTSGQPSVVVASGQADEKTLRKTAHNKRHGRQSKKSREKKKERCRTMHNLFVDQKYKDSISRQTFGHASSDWKCGTCGYINYGTRKRCRECPERKEIEISRQRERRMSHAFFRHEHMEQRRAQTDAEQAKKREEKQQQDEMEEKKKREQEVHRQKIREEYQRKKAKQDALESSGAASTSAASATPQSSWTLPRNQQQRNHSQPPQRPKSEVVVGKSLVGASAGMVPSGSVDNLDQLDNKSQSSDGTGGSGPPVTASSVVPAEPTLKVFVKPSQKTNRNLVLNAIQYCVLAGVVNEPTKQALLTELAKSDSKHFLLLFRDKKCQFKALYSWDQVSDTAHKLYGLGPPCVSEKTMELMFKYDSGAKQFIQIPTRHLSTQIDGFTVKTNIG